MTSQQQELGVNLICLDSVEPELVQWLWEGRIPLGKLTILDGDPGLGKSTLTVELAARITIGANMPDGTPGPGEGGVLMMSLEDGLGDTIRPRLEAAGGNASLVQALESIPDRNGSRLVDLARDIALIEAVVSTYGTRLIVIDPLMGYLGQTVNSYSDQDMRSVLTPLSKMAEKTGCAVLAVRHLNKSGGRNAVQRGGGSIGIIGAARSALLVAADPDDSEARILAPVKSNLGAPVQSLRFRLVDSGAGAARIDWCGTSDKNASVLLDELPTNEEKSAVDEAVAFLKNLLADGEVLSREVQTAAKEAGVSWTGAIRRARQKLGVIPKNTGKGWSWSLPQGERPFPDAQVAQDTQTPSEPPISRVETKLSKLSKKREGAKQHEE